MVIQIDDAHPSGGPYTAILLNGKPLELLEEYTQAAIEDFFGKLEQRDRTRVKIFISDLAPFLLLLGRATFREAFVVADPYHVVRQFLKRYDMLLKKFKRKMLAEYIHAIADERLVRPICPKKSTRKQASEKDDKKPPPPKFREIKILLRSNVKKLDDVQRTAVRFLIRRFPDVRAAYFYLQRLLTLYHTAISSADASRALNKFELRLPAQVHQNLFEFLDLCRTNRDAICAFWACGWTNAECEAQNGVIKAIDRLGRGIKFRELRRRWLYGQCASKRLGRAASPSKKAKTGPPKKKIRELGTLPAQEKVPVLGVGKEGWLFDQPKQKDQ